MAEDKKVRERLTSTEQHHPPTHAAAATKNADGLNEEERAAIARAAERNAELAKLIGSTGLAPTTPEQAFEGEGELIPCFIRERFYFTPDAPLGNKMRPRIQFEAGVAHIPARLIKGEGGMHWWLKAHGVKPLTT
jgi:hypothetical protein